jgi:hypothetical protein
MKKLFTLCVGLLSVLPILAQGFVFQFEGQNLNNDETVIIVAEEDLFGDLSCETNSMMDPSNGLVLKLLRSATANVTATLQISHNSLNAENMQWCMGDECTPLNNQTSLTKRFTVNGSETVQFDATNISGEGYLLATLKATVGLESRQVNIVFVNGDYDGIPTLSQKENDKETVYDLHGRKVQGKPSAGMYIIADRKRVRKVAVK